MDHNSARKKGVSWEKELRQILFAKLLVEVLKAIRLSIDFSFGKHGGLGLASMCCSKLFGEVVREVSID